MLKNKIDRLISKWKGQPYTIDERIPVPYLIRIALTRSFMIIRGFFSGIRNSGHFFISSQTTIRSRSRFKVGKTVSIEKGVYIDALSENGIVFGDNVSAGKNTRIEGTGNLRFLGRGMQVGNNVGLGCNSFYGCAGGISIGDDTIIGNFVSFHAENHQTKDPKTLIRLQGVTHKGIQIGRNCWIGAKATILDGVVLEDGCVVAAGAVVTAGLYRGNGIYGGVPARFIKSRIDIVQPDINIT